jgi:DNA polymerase-1
MQGLALLVLDGRHLLWRAASMFGELTAKMDGEEQHTGAIYGFLRIALSTWSRYGGTTIVAWDNPPTARRAIYPDYKHYREIQQKVADGPSLDQTRMIRELMREQEARLRSLLPILGIRQAEAEGWEADDVIASLCRRFGGEHAVGILSGDRDLLQLVTDKVMLIRPMPKGKFKEETPETVAADFGVKPVQILDLKALAGDPGDNVPGARGIGPKTAATLIQECGGWRQALDLAISTKPPRPRRLQLLVDCAELVRVSAQLVRLNDQLPLRIEPPRRDGRQAFLELTKLKFNSLLTDGRKEQLLEMGGAHQAA